jgi:hypothetical protein
MFKDVYINGNRHRFIFDLVNDKAVNGRFNFNNKLEADIKAEGKTLREVINDLESRVKRYWVTVQETVVTESTWEVFGLDEDDAEHEVLEENGYCLDEDELASETEFVAVEEMQDDTDV